MPENNEKPLERVSAKSYTKGSGNIFLLPILVFFATTGIGRSFDYTFEAIILAMIFAFVLLGVQKRKGVGFIPKWLDFILKTPKKAIPKKLSKNEKDYTAKDFREDYEQKFIKLKNNIKKIKDETTKSNLKKYYDLLEKAFLLIIKSKNITDINFKLVLKLDKLINSIIYDKNYQFKEKEINKLIKEIIKNNKDKKDKKDKKNSEKKEIFKKRKDFNKRLKKLKSRIGLKINKD